MNSPMELRADCEQALINHGVNLQYPNPDTHDLYIGRLVLNSSPIVTGLSELVTPSTVVSAHGHLVVPYMQRRILTESVDNPTSVIEETMHELYEGNLRAHGIEVGSIEVKTKRERAKLRVQYSSPAQNRIDSEIQKTYRILRSLAGVKHPNQPTIRLLDDEIPETKLPEILDVFNEVGLHQATLSLPVVCGVPKKS